MTVGAGQDQLLVTLESLRLIKSNLGVKTVLGISNVSHGMPGRDWLNNTFLVMALGAGLDVAIVNPAQPGLWLSLIHISPSTSAGNWLIILPRF